MSQAEIYAKNVFLIGCSRSLPIALFISLDSALSSQLLRLRVPEPAAVSQIYKTVGFFYRIFFRPTLLFFGIKVYNRWKFRQLQIPKRGTDSMKQKITITRLVTSISCRRCSEEVEHLPPKHEVMGLSLGFFLSTILLIPSFINDNFSAAWRQ